MWMNKHILTHSQSHPVIIKESGIQKPSVIVSPSSIPLIKQQTGADSAQFPEKYRLSLPITSPGRINFINTSRIEGTDEPASTNRGKNMGTFAPPSHKQSTVVVDRQLTTTDQQPITIPVYFSYRSNPVTHKSQSEAENHRQVCLEWERKFFTFANEIAAVADRIDQMMEDIIRVEEGFETVTTEEQWHQLRTQYTELILKYNECREHFLFILKTHLEQQPSNYNQNTSEETWEQKYQQLLSHFQAQAQQLEHLKQEQQQNRTSIKVDGEFEEIQQLRNGIEYVKNQYSQLEHNYENLSNAYNRAVEEIQKLEQNQFDESSLNKLEEELRQAQSKIQQQDQELENKKNQEFQRSKVIHEYDQKFQSYIEERNEMINTINIMSEDLQKFEQELNKKSEEVALKHEELNQKNEQIHQIMSQFNRIKQEQNYFEEYKERLQQTIDALEMRQKELEEIKLVVSQKEKKFEESDRMKKSIAGTLSEHQKKVKQYEKEFKDKNEVIEELKEKISYLEDKIEGNEEDILSQKDRKIKYLEREIQDINQSSQRKIQQKDFIIKQIRDMKYLEQEKLMDKLTQVESKNKSQSQKIKMLENQLGTRNREISQFKLKNQPVNSEELKNLHFSIEKKNHQIQHLKKEIQSLNMQLWDENQELKTAKLQNEQKICEINRLIKQLQQSKKNEVEVESLQILLRKRNQKISELQIQKLEKEKYDKIYENSRKQKEQINEFLSQKTKQCEWKDVIIQELKEKIKIKSILPEKDNTIKINKNTDIVSEEMIHFAELKQKQILIKNLGYEIETFKITVIKQEKMITQLKNAIHVKDKTIWQEQGKKIQALEMQVLALKGVIKNLQSNENDFIARLQEQERKILELESINSTQQRQFYQEIYQYRQKQIEFQKLITELKINSELFEEEKRKKDREKKQLSDKLSFLNKKLSLKNQEIEELIRLNQEKQVAQIEKPVYDGELQYNYEMSTIKIKTLQFEIEGLNKKIKEVEEQRNQYRSKFYANKHVTPNFISIRTPRSQNYSNIAPLTTRQGSQQFNSVYDHKVISSLRIQNSELKRQLAIVSGFSNNLPQSDFQTRRVDELESLVKFHKRKNEQYEKKTSQLLKANQQLRQKLASLTEKVRDSATSQYYKDQISHLELSISQQFQKMENLMNQNAQLRNGLKEKDKIITSLKEQRIGVEEKLMQSNSTIKGQELNIRQLKEELKLLESQMDRLKDQWKKEKKQREKLAQNSNRLESYKKRIKTFEEENSKLKNEVQTLSNSKISKIVEEKDEGSSGKEEEELPQKKNPVPQFPSSPS